MNTPIQGKHVCHEHEHNTTKFVDCSSDEAEKKTEQSDEVQGVMKILEKKETRNSKMFKVTFYDFKKQFDEIIILIY